MLQFSILDYFNVALSDRELSALRLYGKFADRAQDLQATKCEVKWVDNWVPAYEDSPEPTKVSGYFCSRHYELLDAQGNCLGSYNEVRAKVKESAKETLDAAILTHKRICEKLETIGLVDQLQNVDVAQIRNESVSN